VDQVHRHPTTPFVLRVPEEGAVFHAVEHKEVLWGRVEMI
jgi:hypothetical protein